MGTHQYHSVGFVVPQGDFEALTAYCETFMGFCGLQILGEDGEGLIPPPEEFEVLEFGSESAKKFDRHESLQTRSSSISIKVFLESELSPIELKNQFTSFIYLRFPKLTMHFEGLDSRDYLEEYKKNVEASYFSGIWVGPPWKTPPPEALQVYFVEPGMAFGTGDHPTTQMCMEFLSDLSEKGLELSPFVDLGCGSGILTAHALRLFPKAQAFALDLDPNCELECQKCFEGNGIPTERIQGYFGAQAELSELKSQLPLMNLVVSNIYSEVLASLAPDVKSIIHPSGHWVLSGVLEGEPEKLLIEALRDEWKILERRSRRQRDGAESWVSMLLRRS